MQSNLPERTLWEADTLPRADKVLVTDWKFHTCNTLIGNLQEATTSKLRTAYTILGPNTFLECIFTSK